MAKVNSNYSSLALKAYAKLQIYIHLFNFITTLLFDCDNTLVLSETLAFDACASLANRILAKYGVEVNYTGEHLLAEFVGRNFRGMLTLLANKHCVKIPADEFESWAAAEEDAVIAQLQEALMPCDGVSGVLERLQETGAYRLAAVSSSALRRVQASLATVGLDKYFTADAIFSAASSLPIPSSKPDPAIYELALKKLGVTSAECLAVEDSESGVISAHLAGITLVGYTGSYELDEQDSMGKLLLERGATVIMEDWAQFEGILSQIQEI
ncbi:unnamed protein product [Blumeria hordei]|uniref:Uncharacterized protein n=1 Tax=Blumeria hordei TaxID=2867405 RepID=A0A383UQL1_BLUHO|nr:unnamed protein product [Blumeria hordei]